MDLHFNLDETLNFTEIFAKANEINEVSLEEILSTSISFRDNRNDFDFAIDIIKDVKNIKNNEVTHQRDDLFFCDEMIF